MPSSNEIKKIGEQIAPELVRFRRDIHQHPEIGLKEKRTCGKITEALKKIKLDQVRSPVGGTGVVGLLAGAKGKGRTIALRADIDALPVQEENNVPYKSRNLGVMHACGHDNHTAMLVGAAMILKRLQNEINGQVKFIFQPAEECLVGARRMIRAGAMEHPKVDAIFALHVNPEVELGSVQCAAGPIWAAADRFDIEIIGRGGHGAYPFHCVDPILVAAQIYSGLQGIERNLSGTDKRVISVCAIHAGSVFNIIPDIATMTGTVRTFDEKVQATIIRRMREVVRGITAMHGAKYRLNYRKGVPAVINDENSNRILCGAAHAIGMPIACLTPKMGGEDFSFYQKIAPGAMANIGVQTRPGQPKLHNSRFNADERVLPLGAALLAQCALLGLKG